MSILCGKFPDFCVTNTLRTGSFAAPWCPRLTSTFLKACRWGQSINCKRANDRRTEVPLEVSRFFWIFQHWISQSVLDLLMKITQPLKAPLFLILAPSFQWNNLGTISLIYSATYQRCYKFHAYCTADIANITGFHCFYFPTSFIAVRRLFRN